MKNFTVEKKRKIISLISSVVLHFIFFVLIVLSDVRSNQVSKISRQIITLESIQTDNTTKQNSPVEEENVNENISENSQPENVENSEEENFVTLKPEDILNDTTNLHHIYEEKTLDLSIKYPVGWTYIDQNRKNKLDGVTFWSVEGIYNPPPYIHLEVVEKYLFNPNRYKYKVKQYNCEWYFNDPSDLEGQISQEIYIKTEEDEDFRIKLIMFGEDQFRSFQPKFFAIVNTLKWNSGW
ncbi:hypothetical protein [Ignavibacterium sp.]|uniref:hypothetical protein n=1 Tax=Ignavibacterium sp. TaxID=2651167 RepID=UPI00307F9B73